MCLHDTTARERRDYLPNARADCQRRDAVSYRRDAPSLAPDGRVIYRS